MSPQLEEDIKREIERTSARTAELEGFRLSQLPKKRKTFITVESNATKPVRKAA